MHKEARLNTNEKLTKTVQTRHPRTGEEPMFRQSPSQALVLEMSRHMIFPYNVSTRQARSAHRPILHSTTPTKLLIAS
jgi:hypothetical protein